MPHCGESVLLPYLLCSDAGLGQRTPGPGSSVAFQSLRLGLPAAPRPAAAYNELVMRRLAAIFGSAVFLVIAPGTLAGYVPWTITRWHMASPLLGFFPFRILGVLLIAAGLPVLLDSF